MKIQDPIKKLEILRDWNQSCSKIKPTAENENTWPEFHSLMKSITELFEKNVERLDVIIVEFKKQKKKKETKSLKDSILENTSEWIYKTALWRKTKSDKKKCFDTINYLVKENFLETKKEGNMHMFRRRNSDGNFGEKNTEKN